MDEKNYERKQEEETASYEARCKRCGACCGAGNDPCAQLTRDADGRYICKSYNTRTGSQVTVSGKSFTCVPIRSVLIYSLPCQECGYRLP